MNNMLISIIIPAYNIEKYISRCLDSIVEQTYTNLEIIVVDDGSKDNTGKILDDYAMSDNRIHIIHKENGGVTSARLEGIKQSTGEYIGFVDGDDYIDSNMYERLIANMLENNADISHCGYKMVFPNGKIDYYYNTDNKVIQDNQKGIADLISGNYVEPGLCNKLYKRTLFNHLINKQLIDTSIKINEDLLFNYYLFKESKLSVYEDFCPYHYILRKNSAATSKINQNKLIDPIKVSKIILEDCKSNVVLSNTVEIRLVRQMISIACMSVKENKELIYLFRKQIRKELRSRLFGVLKNNAISMKLKIMALWVCVFPTSYRVVHTIYARISGIDKKYDIEG